MLLKVTKQLTDDQFSWRPSATAPPIGWHLWHIARWADRLQASFPSGLPESRAGADPNFGIWEADSLASAWGLERAKLGILETGSGMEIEQAAQLPRAGMTRIADYAQRAFEALEQVLSDIDQKSLEQPRESVEQFKV